MKEKKMGTKELIDAIQSGDAEGIESTFQGVMSAKVGDKLDTMKKEMASTMFKTPEEQDEIAGEPEQPEEVPAEPVEEPAENVEEV